MWWFALCALMFIFSPKNAREWATLRQIDQTKTIRLFLAFCLQMSTMFPLFAEKIFKKFSETIWRSYSYFAVFFFLLILSRRNWKSWRKMRKIGKSRARNNNRMKNINQQWGFWIFVTNEDRTNERKSKHAVLFFWQATRRIYW